jgi:hypothetical protein
MAAREATLRRELRLPTTLIERTTRKTTKKHSTTTKRPSHTTKKPRSKPRSKPKPPQSAKKVSSRGDR